MTFIVNTTGAMIQDWAFDDSGAAITVGAVPEPVVGTFTLLGMCSVLIRRRR